jgi:hypothetical protein
MENFLENLRSRRMIFISIVSVSCLTWRDVLDNFKYRIHHKYLCPAFGYIERCEDLINVCKISLIAAVTSFIAGSLTNFTKGCLLFFIKTVETSLYLGMIVLWGGMFAFLILWSNQTFTIHLRPLAISYLFTKVLVLICLFFIGTILAWNQGFKKEGIIFD